MTGTRRTPGIAIIAVVALGVLLAILVNVRARREVAAYKARLAAQGEKLGVDELTPSPSLAGRTSANRLLHAAWQLTPGTMLTTTIPGAMRPVGPGKAVVAWKQPELRDPGRATNTWETVGADLAGNERVLQEIREILRDSTFDIGLDYRQGFNLLLPHLAKFKVIARWLSADATFRLHTGELELAREDLLAMLELVDSSREERLLICQLVRIALAAIAFAPTWEALQADGWTDDQLASLQARWRSLEFVKPMEQAMQMERATSLEAFQRLRKSPAQLRQLLDGSGVMGGAPSGLVPPTSASELPEFASQLGEKTVSATRQLAQEKGWLWLWSHRDEKRYLELMQIILEVARGVERGRPFVVCQGEGRVRIEAIRPIQGGDSRYLLSESLGSVYETALPKAVRLEAQRDLMVTAVALKRYLLRHRRPAPSLASLVPDFLPAVPRDLMDGGELRYRPGDDGSFRLYSVNDDGRDDGGDPQPPKEMVNSRFFGHGRDLVWPMPATAAEIAAEKPGRRK